MGWGGFLGFRGDMRVLRLKLFTAKTVNRRVSLDVDVFSPSPLSPAGV